MSSSGMYTLVNRIDDGNIANGRHQSTMRFQVLPNVGANTTSVRNASPFVHLTDQRQSDVAYETSIKSGNTIFVYLDLQSELTPDSIASLRAINNEVQVYTDSLICLNFVRRTHDRIFFISPTADRELMKEFHPTQSVEAIFILSSDADIDSGYPKLCGMYGHFEELLTALRDTLEWFERNQLELFVFESDRIFLWSQLWKEEFINQQKSIGMSSKEELVRLGKSYYEEKIPIHQPINEFNQGYLKGDALQWCFTSPFPSRLLQHALHSHNIEHLQVCRFLLSDASRNMQLTSKKSSCELYKGMKMTEEFLNKLENSIEQLICQKGFFLCSQSRKAALTIASSSDHRPDLLPVLFKITYDQSAPLGELPQQDSSSLMVFDVYTVFRVKYVTRGEVSTVKIELADEDGKKIAQMYRARHGTQSVQSLLDQLCAPPKPPVRLPSLLRTSSPPPVSSDLSPNDVGLSVISEDDDETEVQELIERGEIDQALEIYLRWKPESARVFNTIAMLYAQKKGDYESSIKYLNKALELQEEAGEDMTGTLAQLGILHQNRREYDLAWSYHSRALHKRKKMPHIDQTSIAGSLIGMANAYWGQQNFVEALQYAEEALALNESIERGNDVNIATNLAIIANIYHNAGENSKALEIATRALGILERYVPADSLVLATLINNLATMQVTEGLLADARRSFDRALEICRKSLPEGHPKRVSMETNIQRIIEMEERHEERTQL